MLEVILAGRRRAAFPRSYLTPRRISPLRSRSVSPRSLPSWRSPLSSGHLVNTPLPVRSFLASSQDLSPSRLLSAKRRCTIGRRIRALLACPSWAFFPFKILRPSVRLAPDRRRMFTRSAGACIQFEASSVSFVLCSSGIPTHGGDLESIAPCDSRLRCRELRSNRLGFPWRFGKPVSIDTRRRRSTWPRSHWPRKTNLSRSRRVSRSRIPLVPPILANRLLESLFGAEVVRIPFRFIGFASR